MKKLSIGPILIGLVIIALVGGFLSMSTKKPRATEDIAVVVAPPTANAPAVLPVTANTAALTSEKNPQLAPGEDPPARREPGAINYADKGVLPAL